MKPYHPISCALHSQYELWIMHADNIVIDYRQADAEDCQVSGIGIDLMTRHGEEFIVVQATDDSSVTIRLDHIITAKSL